MAEKKNTVTLHRDPNTATVTTSYQNGPMSFVFDPSGGTVEVEENHVMFIVRDCADLWRTKPKTKKAKSTE